MAAVQPIPALERLTLNQVINRRITPFMGLRGILFPSSTETVLTTGSVQIDELTGAGRMAPMIKQGGKSIMIGQKNGRNYTVSTPNININRPLSASDELLLRGPGQSVFANGVDVIGQAFSDRVADDLKALQEAVDLREEWMISQILTGTISYDVDGNDTWDVETAKPADNTYTVSTLWTAANPTPISDVRDAWDLVLPYRGPGLPIGICSKEAAAAFTTLLEKGHFKDVKFAHKDITKAGSGSLSAKFNERGLRYVGTISDTDLWEYSAKYLDDDGNEQPYIRAGYIEYIPANNVGIGMNKLFYGAIIDAQAISQNLHIAKRYSHTELDADCGTLVQYYKTRPLPYIQRSDWYVSQKVA